MELSYLIMKFKLDKNKLPINKLLVVISLINSFIISFVYVILVVFKTKLIFKFLIGFIILMGLIYTLYEFLGRYLERKQKNGK